MRALVGGRGKGWWQPRIPLCVGEVYVRTWTGLNLRRAKNTRLEGMVDVGVLRRLVCSPSLVWWFLVSYFSPSNRTRARGRLVKMVKKVGKYEIGKTIGEGTFGKVKLAINTETGEKMAIKVR